LFLTFVWLRSNLIDVSEVKIKQAQQAAEKVGRFLGRGFSHDVKALHSPGVLTPEARKYHLSAAHEACLFLNFVLVSV